VRVLLRLVAVLLLAGPAWGTAAEAPAGQPAKGSAPPAQPFSQESVRAVVLEHQPQVQACYENALVPGKRLQGEVVVSLTVSREGKPENVKVKSSTIKNRAVEGCLVQAVRGWTFPRPPRAQPLTLPFRFDEAAGEERTPGKAPPKR
jgi:TonB family protein